MQRALDAAHKPLERAVVITREVIINGLIPNSAETVGHLYHCHTYVCRHCESRLNVPCPDPVSDHFCHRICPNCGLWSAVADGDLEDASPTTEIGYGSLVRGYIEVSQQHWDRLDPDWMRKRGLSSDDEASGAAAS